MVGGQVLIILSAATLLRSTLSMAWGLSIGLGAILVPWGALLRKFTDIWVAALVPNIKIRIPMPWHKRKHKAEGDIDGATSVASRDPSAKGPGAQVTDLIDGKVEFEAPLRTLTSLCGKRVRKYIRRGFHKYMYDQKAEVKEKTKEVVC